MALILEKMTNKGYNAGYWVIEKFHLVKNTDNKNIFLTISGYKDKEIRDKGESLDTKNISFSLEENEITSIFETVEILYSNIKGEKNIKIDKLNYQISEAENNVVLNSIHDILLTFLYTLLKSGSFAGAIDG